MSVMRSTSIINNYNSLFQMARNSSTMNNAYTKLSMQQQVVNLSDNPLAANLGIRMKTMMAQTNQFNRNISMTGIPALQDADTTIRAAIEEMKKIKGLMVDDADSYTDALQYSTNQSQISIIMDNILAMANKTDGRRYLFGGHNTTNPPFEVVNGRYVNYTGNRGDINLIVDRNTQIPMNVSGDEVFGNMETKIPSRNMSADVSLSTDHSTPLADLNGGAGAPKGKIIIKYSAYPDGLEVDLSGCDTLEDVKDTIEKATLDASRALNTTDHRWLETNSLDWHDLEDRFVKVTINPENNGISLQEFDLGEPLPQPTATEAYHNLTYSGTGGYVPGGHGAAGLADPGEAVTVHNLLDGRGRPFKPLSVDDFAGNKVATGLGIKGTAKAYDHVNAANRDPVVDGFLHGSDLNPRITEHTLLADIEGYNDGTFTFTNGEKPGSIVLRETVKDANNIFDDWNLTGLTKNKNTGANGELFARVVNRGTDADPEMYVELYTRDPAKATAAQMVAAGRYNGEGATTKLEEVNNSGLSGTVGINLPDGIKTASVEMKAEFNDSIRATVHVPAFIEEQYENGLTKDVLGIASGWNIRGLDKPPASGHDINHPASTDLDGNVSVNYRYDETDGYMYIELSRPSYDDQPAQHIATGKIFVGAPGSAGYPLDAVSGLPTGLADPVSGRVEFVGEPGFEDIGGSVYIELPDSAIFSDANTAVGTGANNPTTVTYVMRENIAPGEVVLGGAMEVIAPGVEVNGSFTLSEDTAFLEGQVFDAPVRLPGGGMLPAGQPLLKDTLLPKGTVIDPAGTLAAPGDTLMPGTVLPEGQLVDITALPAGTVIPKGSYTVGGAGFPADGMSMTVGTPPNETTVSGYDVQATFATVEDLQRAVHEAGVYARVEINEKGNGFDFTSTLAGAYFTVSEDVDGYEQMGDRNRQLTGLDLTGLVKGVSADDEGNAYTEVVFYPPDPLNPNAKIKVHDKNGKLVELDPGYYVRVYSDKAERDLPYADRSEQQDPPYKEEPSLIAEGFIPAGEWDPAFLAVKDTLEADAKQAHQDYLDNLTAAGVPADDPRYLVEWDLWQRDTTINQTNPGANLAPMPMFTPAGVGAMRDLILEERNNSGVSGTVDLDYHGSRPQTATLSTYTDSKGDLAYAVDYAPDDNDDITVYPGGFRQMTGKHLTVQEMDLYDPTPGINTDFSGTIHGTVSAEDPITNNRVVTLYRDGSKEVMTAKSDPATGIGPNGEVTLYNVDKHGNFLDKAGNVLDITTHPLAQYGMVAGTMTVDAANLPADDAEDFTMITGAARTSGQEREENIFSTINDVLDAMGQADEEKLHDLLGSIQADMDRALAADGKVSTRQQRMEMLYERHKTEYINYSDIWTSRVGMDDEAYMMGIMDFQAAMNGLNAAMQAHSQTMNLSLLNYI